MVINWSMSKDEIYGPPPAYSVDPPPAIYIIPEIHNEHQERPSSHASIIFSLSYLRYLLGAGLLHMLIGITTIVCDILLISMNESYSFTGLWAGVSCIILGIYLILFMTYPKKPNCSLYRFQFLHIAICIIIIIALILSSINLVSNSCPAIYFESDQCHHSAEKLKIILVTFFAFSFLQICITLIITCIQTR